MTTLCEPNTADLARPAAPELLAPAGDWEALRAGVANGADAVYFGLESLNARRRAANFTRAELPAVIRYLHDHNVRGYVTVNTLIFAEELPQAVEYVLAIARAGADAVIVQDLGLVRLIRRLAPTLPIHASTQMTQTEADGIEFLRSLGVSRVILARELSLAEIAQVARDTPMPLEVFVHGALCISYSGQCLASEALWGRSANRGLCGQACRLPYKLVVDGQTRDLGAREYLLSAQDLSAYDRVPELVKLGVAGFKIEGRLKSAHYVAAATRLYRAALDAALQHVPFRPSAEQTAELAQSFSRGLSHGFLDGINHQDLVHGCCPKSRGVYVGRVVAKTQRGVIVDFAGAADTLAPSRLKPGDGVVFDEGHPEQDEQGGRVFSVESARNTAVDARARTTRCVELTFGRGDVNLAAVGLGSHVWKTDDPAVRRRLAGSFRRDRVVRRVLLHVSVHARVGEPLRVALRADDGQEVQVSGDHVLQPAVKHALTIDLIREQFGRLGDTPFALGRVELLGDNGAAASQPVMVPKSVLNNLRRRAVQALLDHRAAAHEHEIVAPDALEVIRDEIKQRLSPQRAGDPVGAPDAPPQLHVLVRSLEQMAAALQWQPLSTAPRPALLYCDFQDLGDCAQAVALARAAGRPIALTTPRVLISGEESELDRIAVLKPDAVLVRSLGAASYLRRRVPQLPLIGDYSLNVANEIAVLVLLEYGLSRLTPSYDLNWTQLSTLLTHVSDPPAAVPKDLFEVVLHQHMPLFHTRHCLFVANLSDGTRCGNCGWRCRSHTLHLRDRVGALHPVRVDGLGCNTVFHAAAQSAAQLVPALLRLGVRHFRVELLHESAAQTGTLLEIYGGLLAGSTDPATAVRRLRPLNPAGVTLGTFARE